eukprot:2033036-Prymnesium_polylepis.1
MRGPAVYGREVRRGACEGGGAGAAVRGYVRVVRSGGKEPIPPERNGTRTEWNRGRLARGWLPLVGETARLSGVAIKRRAARAARADAAAPQTRRSRGRVGSGRGVI